MALGTSRRAAPSMARGVLLISCLAGCPLPAASLRRAKTHQVNQAWPHRGDGSATGDGSAAEYMNTNTDAAVADGSAAEYMNTNTIAAVLKPVVVSEAGPQRPSHSVLPAKLPHVMLFTQQAIYDAFKATIQLPLAGPQRDMAVPIVAITLGVGFLIFGYLLCWHSAAKPSVARRDEPRRDGSESEVVGRKESSRPPRPEGVPEGRAVGLHLDAQGTGSDGQRSDGGSMVPKASRFSTVSRHFSIATDTSDEAEIHHMFSENYPSLSVAETREFLKSGAVNSHLPNMPRSTGRPGEARGSTS